MAIEENSPARRRRGSIRRVGSAVQVRVSAGKDPHTGERIVLSETIRIEKPGNEKSEREAAKEAETKLTRLLADADEVKAARSKATIGALFDKWLSQHDVEQTTLESYESLIRLYLRPALGAVTLTLFMKNPVERLEQFYAELRRCRQRCNRRPFIEHKAAGEHDCVKATCSDHECDPLAPASVRRVHFVLSGALTAAKRWGWISYNPADMAKKPAAPTPQPRPPSAVQMASIVERAWQRENEFGLFVWLSAILGTRRGEVSLCDSITVTSTMTPSISTRTGCGPAEGLLSKTPKITRCAAFRLTRSPSTLFVATRPSAPTNC